MERGDEAAKQIIGLPATWSVGIAPGYWIRLGTKMATNNGAKKTGNPNRKHQEGEKHVSSQTIFKGDWN